MPIVVIKFVNSTINVMKKTSALVTFRGRVRLQSLIIIQKNTRLTTNKLEGDNADFSVFEGTWCLPEWPKVVVPRPKLLKALHEVMGETSAHQQPDANLVRLVGALGSGKSLLALQYAHWLYQEQTVQSVVWLDAQGENAAYLRDQWRFLMAGLGLDISGAQDHDIEQTYVRLTTFGKTLVVIDDVADFSVVKPYLSCRDPAVSLLITTRNGVRWDYRCRDVTMLPMSLKQAVSVLQGLLASSPSLLEQLATKKTAQAVYSHPLLLQEIAHQAIADQSDLTSPMLAYGTVFKAGAILYQLQTDPFGYKLLLRLAYLHPHHSIPLPLMLVLLGDEELELELLDAIALLKRYGLLSDAREPEQYFLSSIVRYLMRQHLSAPAQITLITQVLEVLLQWLNTRHTPDDPVHCYAVMQEGLRWVQLQRPHEQMARQSFFATNRRYQIAVPESCSDTLKLGVAQYNRMITGESDGSADLIARALFIAAK